MGNRRTYTDEQLIQVVPKVFSIAKLLSALNLRPAGGNYATIKRRIKELDLDTSHFRGQAWLSGMKFQVNKPKPLAEILVRGSVYQSSLLKKRLIETGLRRACCEICGLQSWQGGPPPLELDHINGRSDDNRLDNLRIICPNCHALTSTYRAKNRSSQTPP